MRIYRIAKLGIPAMDRHSSLNVSLNEDCQKSKLTSWTKHVNQRGTVYTIRFQESSAILDPSDPDNSRPKKITYKPKTQYHINRDFTRMSGFKNSDLPVRPFHNNTIDDNSYISDMYHSKPNSYVNNQQANQAEYDSSATQECVIGSDASSHDMHNDSPTQMLTHNASVAKTVHHTSEIQNPPLVEFESIDDILPLVCCKANESIPTHAHDDALYHASCYSPIIQPPAELISFSDELTSISEPCTDSSVTKPPHWDLLYNSTSDFDSSFVTQPTLENKCGIDPGYVEKTLSCNDILCNACSATVPSGTKMLYCESCSLHICGNCVLSQSHSHSITCRDELRYMSDTEMHLQYVPDSKDNSVISDCSQPPGNCDNNQVVPQAESDAKDFIRSLLDDSRARFIEDLQTSLRDAIDNTLTFKERSASDRFGK